MIRGREWKTLKGQLLLTAGMCAACLAAAIFMATQVRLAEKYTREKYDLTELTEEVRELIKQASRGDVDRVAYLKLDEEARRQVYQDWIAREEHPPAATPHALLKVDTKFYLRCVEQTLVCGSSQQRQRALDFLISAPSSKTPPLLEKLLNWAHRRNLPGFTQSLSQTNQVIERRLQAGK